MSEKVPKGWKRYNFTDIAEIIGGGTPSKKVPEYWDGDIDWLTVNDFNNGVEMFPSCIIANCMNLKSKNFFEIPKFEQKNVNFDNSF